MKHRTVLRMVSGRMVAAALDEADLAGLEAALARGLTWIKLPNGTKINLANVESIDVA